MWFWEREREALSGRETRFCFFEDWPFPDFHPSKTKEVMNSWDYGSDDN
jgi:hypothetical protein